MSSSNNKFVSVDFETPQVQDIFAAPAGTNLRQLGVRQDDEETICIVAASNDGEVAVYDRTTGVAQPIASVQGADGLALNADGDAFIVTDGGSSDPLVFVPRNFGGPSGCVAGGYHSQRFIDSQIDLATDVADVKIAHLTTSLFGAGDALVLIRLPSPKIVRYAAEDIEERRGATPPGDASPAMVKDLSGLDPVAFAVTPFGEILVALSTGQFRRFSNTGQAITDPTLPLIPGVPVNLAVGLQDFGPDSGVPAAFVTFATGGDGVVRYRIEDDGTLTSPTVITSSLPSAQGVGNASLTAVAFTPVAANGVTVRTTATELTFSEVTDDGLTLFRLFTFEDTGRRMDGALHLEDVDLPDEARLSGAIIPADVVPMTGDNTFYLFIGTTTAEFDGVIAGHTIQESLGLDLLCDNEPPMPIPDPDVPGGTSREPRMYQASSASDLHDPVFPSRNGLFFDMTSGCASCCLFTSHRKCLFLAAKSNLNHTERITEKFDVLQAEFAAGKSCIKGSQRTKLQKVLDAAEQAFVDEDYALAVRKLQLDPDIPEKSFADLASIESSFLKCEPSFNDALIAITNTTVWDLKKLF